MALACGVALAAASLPVLGHGSTDSGESRSLANLRRLAIAHEAYANTFAGKQMSVMPEDAGTVGGSCVTYLSSIACPPQLILGFAPDGTAWGYFLGQGFCAFLGYPSGCGNWPVYKPLEFGGSSQLAGSYRLPNNRAFSPFVDGRFYSDTFCSPNDRRTWDRGAPYRDGGYDFISSGSVLAESSYCLSPAAMYHPDVLGSAFAGYRDPNTFVEGYISPTVSQCAYPDLKTRMIERRWNVGSPGFQTETPEDASGFDGWSYNASALASPQSLFFDGHVGRIRNTDAIADDAAVQASGGIGLWSRTTPLGEAGYAPGPDPSPNVGEPYRTSHTILTIDGILGRDLLLAR